MSKSRHIQVRIKGDSRKLRRAFLRSNIVTERGWWQRLKLRVDLWRLNRDIRRNPRP